MLQEVAALVREEPLGDDVAALDQADVPRLLFAERFGYRAMWLVVAVCAAAASAAMFVDRASPSGAADRAE